MPTSPPTRTTLIDNKICNPPNPKYFSYKYEIVRLLSRKMHKLKVLMDYVVTSRKTPYFGWFYAKPLLPSMLNNKKMFGPCVIKIWSGYHICCKVERE